MAKVFHSDFASKAEQDDYDEVRRRLNEYLDSDSMLRVAGQNISRREIMTTCIYGGLSHANKEKKIRSDGWMRNSLLGPMMQNEFSMIMHTVLKAVACLKQRCDRLLARNRVKDAIDAFLDSGGWSAT